MTIKSQIAAAAACLDDLRSGTLSGEALIQEQTAAIAHVDFLYSLIDEQHQQGGAQNDH